MTEQVVFTPGADSVVVENATITGSIVGAVNVTGAVTATGAVTGASVTATGAVSGASVVATGAISGASVTATGAVTGATIVATGSITTPDIVDTLSIKTTSIAVHDGLSPAITLVAGPTLARQYNIPDAGSDGNIGVSVTNALSVDVSEVPSGISRLIKELTVTRVGRVVTVEVGDGPLFDGASAAQLSTTVVLDPRYRPALQINHFPAYVRSGGVNGYGLVIIRGAGRLEFYARNGGNWDGADCNIYGGCFTFVAGLA